MRTSIALAATLSACLVLGGCEDTRQAAQTAMNKANETSGVVSNAIREAKSELAKGNFKLGGEHGSLPRAEITPDGQLLIDGKAVAMTESQKALTLAYRKELIAIAEAGMDIGSQGVDFAAKAVGEAIKGALSGTEAEVRARIEAEAEQFRTAALAICDHLPALLKAQERVVGAFPEIAPYARVTVENIEDCRKDVSEPAQDDEIRVEA